MVAEADAEQAVRVLLEWIGEDPTRNGLLDTPGRVARAWREMTAGYDITDSESLATVFDETYDEMVVLTGITFNSTCEHHLLPFHGTATIGYLPRGRIVGLSKLARVTSQYALRLQNQERLSMQIADAIENQLNPWGTGVVLRAHHTCMSCRGVKQGATSMITSVLRGSFRDDATIRSEFLAFAHES